MAYFSKYIDKLKSLKNDVSEDITLVKNDDRLLASLINFKKEVEQMIAIAANNSAIEGKASLMPEGVQTHWWAGSGTEPGANGNHESLSPHPNSGADSGADSGEDSGANP